MRTIKARNGFVFTFPFEPPWEDLRAEGSTPNGGKFYIFDSCVIRDPEERAAIDRRVADVFVQAERRKFLAALEAEEQAARRRVAKMRDRPVGGLQEKGGQACER